jgi:hypothetical protein
MRHANSDLTHVEAKAAAGELPKRLWETLSAFSNTIKGGTLVLGVSEELGFKIVGVKNPKKLQQDLASLCDVMSPPIRAYIEIHRIQHKAVITAEIPEIPTNAKPCYYPGAGYTNGAFIRIADGDRKLSAYEVQMMLSARGQPRDDEEAVPGTTVADLQARSVRELLSRLRKRPGSVFSRMADDAILRTLKVLVPAGKKWVCSLGGSGLTSLQARDEKGATTHEVQSAVSAPARVRIARRGDYFYMWLAGPGEELRMAGGSMRVPLHDPVYVGIGVCSHDKDVVEKAVFSNVDLAGAPAGTGQPVLYSTLETVPISSGDRRVVYVAAERLASPRWSPDGAWLSFKRKGRTERVPAAGGEPAVVDTVDSEAASDSKFTYFQSDRSGSMQIWRTRSDGSGPEQLTSGDFQNCFPHVSPDGKQMVFLSYAKELSGIPEDQDVMLRLMSLGDAGDRKIKVLARLVGGKGTIDAPSWSPDSRSLAFVSYQLIQ